MPIVWVAVPTGVCVVCVRAARRHPWDMRVTGDSDAIRQAIVSDEGPSFEGWPASAEAREVRGAPPRRRRERGPT